ncbi:YeeE/YedE family protein [Limnohabitans sp. B9-3]|uniref:YeeE/YedE family protein n=1 Tax=Limnohabitans sp. B9-3 TaxID=1100707 RepID=UPI000C1E30E1|nr:YeeE/YedE family protein [Limnohabitans sp. B9-3]PIT76210.1 YeeE/YedE [Limnohabitans sp. B9-3]
MQIDWNHFTPWMSLAGGILLGIASAMFILVNGRILGISGIVGGLLAPKVRDASWRIAFLLGLFVSPLAARLLFPSDWISTPRIDAGWGAVVAAGLMVGLGTRYGAGCTSGHGVCGLSRLSPRSLVATLSFMAAGFAMVFVMRHVI